MHREVTTRVCLHIKLVGKIGPGLSSFRAAPSERRNGAADGHTAGWLTDRPTQSLMPSFIRTLVRLRSKGSAEGPIRIVHGLRCRSFPSSSFELLLFRGLFRAGRHVEMEFYIMFQLFRDRLLRCQFRFPLVANGSARR